MLHTRYQDSPIINILHLCRTLVTTNKPIMIHYSFTWCPFFHFRIVSRTHCTHLSYLLKVFLVATDAQTPLVFDELEHFENWLGILGDLSHWGLFDVFLMIRLGYIFWKVDHKLKCLFNYITARWHIINRTCHCLGELWSPGWSNVCQIFTVTFLSPLSFLTDLFGWSYYAQPVLEMESIVLHLLEGEVSA